MVFKNKQDYENQRKALIDKAQTLINEGKVEEAKAVMESEIKELDKGYDDYATTLANLKAMNIEPKAPVKVNTNEPSGNILNGGYATRAEMLNSLEYRTAFMNNVINGTAIPAKFRNADAQTATTDVGAIIPTHMVQKIYTKLETCGKFYAMATKSNYKGGVSIPTSSVNLTASWVGERGTADGQKVTTGSVTFAYRKLLCKVPITFETSVVTLDIFESFIVEQVTKAMVKAIEKAMFVGDGATANQPVGFLTETPAEGQALEIKEGDHITYAKLCEAEAALPESYDSGAIWVMSKKTFFTEIAGMTDTNGQPIARVNIGIDGKIEHVILGRRVEFAEYMPSFATSVTADTIVAAIFDFSAYIINTNYEITMRNYIDEDTDDIIKKALMLTDGKVVDKNSLVTLTIKNS